MKSMNEAVENYHRNFKVLNSILRCQVFVCKHNVNNLCFSSSIDLQFVNDASGLAVLSCQQYLRERLS